MAKKKVQPKEYVVIERAYLDELQADASVLEDVMSALSVNGFMQDVPLTRAEQKRKEVVTTDEFVYEGEFDEYGQPTFRV